MPCSTPGCPAELASAPRRYHDPSCRYAKGRSGKSTKSGGQTAVRVRPDIAEHLRALRNADLDDATANALQTVRAEHEV